MRTIAALFLALALPALAETPEPPGRVGRVASTQGEVALFLDPERGWESAYVNSPLTSENSVWTEGGARADVRVGPVAMRLDEFTQLDIRRLDDERIDAHVPRGTLAFSVRHFEPTDRYAIGTPWARLHVQANGRYRIQADDAAEVARFAVFAGSASLEVAGRRIPVAAGEAVQVSADGGQFDFERIAATPFDEWVASLDARIADSESSRYVSPQMTGYEDLDRYGRWSQDEEYGAVWYPESVGDDYVPYRNGNWVYNAPWGWTWVDYAPWGYAPFHYGRWVYVRNRWGWSPGRYVARPVWAPAMVAWVGRPGWSVSVGAGSAPVVGWYPLGYYDRYRPWYNHGSRYNDRINGHVRPRDRDRDRDRDGRPNGRPRDDDRDRRERATTIVLREGFVNQRPVANSMAPVSGEVAGRQPVAQGAAVLPSRGEAVRRKPAALPASVPTGRPAGSDNAARTPYPRGGEPSRATAPANNSAPVTRTPAPTYRAPATAPSWGVPPASGESSRAARSPEPRPQTKPTRVQPSVVPPALATPLPPHTPMPAATPMPPPNRAARSPNRIEERPPQPAQPVAPAASPAPVPAPQRKPAAEREAANDRSSDAPPQPMPTQKPARVQQR